MEHQYHVVEFLEPPYKGFDKLVCIPQSWVQLPCQASHNTIAVKYPVAKSSETNKRMKEGGLFGKEWPMYWAKLIHTSESYQEAQIYIDAHKKYYAEQTKEDLAKETNSKKSVTFVPSNNHVDRRSDTVATTSKGTGSAKVVDEREKEIKEEKEAAKNTDKGTRNKDDTKWTLRHLKPSKGIVELIDGSNVFVNSASLKRYVKIASNEKHKNVIKLAQLLLELIFTKKALETCCFPNPKIPQNGVNLTSAVDRNAREVLLKYVGEYAKANNWKEIDQGIIIKGIRGKISEIQNRIKKNKTEKP